jgi:hypothetical protein
MSLICCSSSLADLTFGHFCPKIDPIIQALAANGQARQVHCGVRDEAREKGLLFRAEKWRGKGGHMMVFVGHRLTTVPSREIDPKTARKIRKQLGLAD